MDNQISRKQALKKNSRCENFSGIYQATTNISISEN